MSKPKKTFDDLVLAIAKLSIKNATEEILDNLRCDLCDLSFDDILRGVIAESDLMEIVSCLDVIASEEGKRVRLYEGDEQIYPVGE